MTKSTFRFIIGIATALCMTQSIAQVGIGTTTPKGALDITSSNSGLLIPRISIPNVNNAGSTIIAPETSLLIYNTNAGITGGNGVGFYYWDSTEWVKLETRPSSDWTLLGNSGTNPSINFVGTKDNVDLVFKTNDSERVRFDTDGRILATQTTLGTIGTSPSYTWNGDVDSGLRRNGSDDIALMAGDTGLIHLVETGTGNTVTIEPGTDDDTDFSVDSRTQNGFLFADGSSDRVGIGTTAPTHKLHIIHNANEEGVMTIQNNTNGGFAGAYFNQNGNYRGHIGYVNTGGDPITGFASPGDFQIASGDRDLVFSATNGAETFEERMRISKTGTVSITDLNSTNSANNNGTDLAPVVVNANGDLQVGTAIYGNNIQSVVLSGADQTINGGYTNINGATITFTPKHSTVYLSFAISGYNPLTDDDQQSWVGVRVRVDGSNSGTFLSMSASADDILGAVGAATVSAGNYPITGLTPGTPVTINLQARDGGNNHSSGFLIDKSTWTSYMTILD